MTVQGELAVSGRIDCLDLRSIDGSPQLVMVDYKSGRRLLMAYDARSSLALASSTTHTPAEPWAALGSAE